MCDFVISEFLPATFIRFRFKRFLEKKFGSCQSAFESMESDTRSFLGSESVVGQTSEVDRFPKLLVDGFFEGWELWFV